MSSNTSFNPYLPQAEKAHSTYWLGDPNMLRDTKNYCDQALSLVDGGIIRSGVQHPWQENVEHDASRVRIVDFAGDGRAEQQDHAGILFSDARDLNAHLSAPTQKPSPGSRKLIIIEGLEPRILEVVGVKFGIPASFFLGHCDEWADINIVDRACAKQSNPVYWKIQIPRARHIDTKALKKQLDQTCYGNIITGIAERRELVEIRCGVERARVEFPNLISYWGLKSPYKGPDSGWTAIVLVDPRLAKIRQTQDIIFDLKDLDVQYDWNLFSEAIVWNKSPSSEQDIGLGPTAWSTPTAHRNHCKALFDEITKYFQECGLPSQSDDPISSTVYIRNFVRSAWEEAIWRWDSNFHLEMQMDEGKMEHQRINGELTGAMVVESYHDWRRKAFHNKSSLQGVRRIMQAFRCNNYAYPKSWPDDPLPSAADISVSEARALECLSWALMAKKLELIDQDLCDHVEMLAQRAALLPALEAEKQTEQARRQADEANRMARSSGQLTKIATVIVPCSFVASIFSMGGEFAVGKSLFFVYWAISMPVTFILLVWVMFGNRFADAWNETRREFPDPELMRTRWAMLRYFMSNLRSSGR